MIDRSSLLYLMGRIATGLVGLASLAVFTRVLSAANYGRYSVVVAVAGLIAAVLFQWLRQCLIRFGTHDVHRRRRLLATIGVVFFALVAITGVAASVVWLALFRTVAWAVMILLICLLAWAQAWFELSMDAARMDFRAARYSISSVARAAFALLLGTLGALWTRSDTGMVLGVTCGYLLGALLPAPDLLAAATRCGQASMSELREMLRYGAPLSMTLGFIFIVDSADRLMLAAMRTETEVGVYAAAYNLAQFSLGTLLTGINLGTYPQAVKALDSEGPEAAGLHLGRCFLLLLGIGTPAAVGLALEAHAVGPLLLGNYNPDISPIVIGIVAFAILLAGLRAYCFDLVFMLRRKTALQASIVMGAAALNIALNIMVIPAWGALGAALATFVSFGVAAVASLTIGSKLLRIRVAISDIWKILASVLCMIVAFMLWPIKATWLQVLVGTTLYGLVYTGFIYLLNPGGAREWINSGLRSSI